MPEFNERIERSLLKIFVSGAGLALLVFAAGYFGSNAVRAWQVRRVLAEANALLNEGDYKQASLDARHALELNPQNATAMRVVARSAENSGLRSAINAWRRVTELSKSESDVIAWARCGVRFGDTDSASKALNALSQTVKSTAEYHALQSDVALIRHDLVGYEKELLEAKRIDPQNKKYQLALATLHVAANDIATHEVGVAELLSLRADESFRQDSLHRLADDALRRDQISRAIEYGQELEKLPNCNFSDRLLLLSIRKAAGDAQTLPLFMRLKEEAKDDPVRVDRLLAWLNSHNMAIEALEWISALPPTTLVKRSVPFDVVNAFTATGDWNGLRKFCLETKWEASDYLRNAWAARALREAGELQEANQQWNAAVDRVRANSEQIFGLAELARNWGWQNEALDLWWVAAKDSSKAEKTLRMLYDFYARQRDTHDLYRVLVHLEEVRPNDRAVENNLAQVSLLLNLDTDRAHRLAREIYEQERGNIEYASTYAFSLYLEGDTRRGLQVFADFSEAQLERPQIAAYYGLMLASNGDVSRASKFLALGEKANLLPEERKLVEKAQLTIAHR